MKNVVSLCPGGKSNFKILTEHLGKICKYHKRANQTFQTNDIVRDFCPYIFFVAYPYCLALLYNAKFAKNNDSIKLCCPQNSGIVFTISRKRCWSLPVGAFYKFLKWISQKISFPLDIEDYHIQLEIVDDKSTCPKKLTRGSTYQFNINKLDELCPASFYQLFPFLFGRKKLRINCPDHEGMSYRISES